MTIVEKSSAYVRAFFEENLSPKNVYHSLEHTERVVEKVESLAKWEHCNDIEKQWLSIAAWFHDTGFVKQDDDNEPIGAEIAVKFLEQEHADQNTIEIVKRLILVTKPGVEPQDLLEKIIKDADCSHLGASYYGEVSAYLKQELEYKKGKKIPDLFWAKNNLAFFNDHMFYTDSAKEHWQAQKDINRFNLEKEIEKKTRKKTKEVSNE